MKEHVHSHGDGTDIPSNTRKPLRCGDCETHCESRGDLYRHRMEHHRTATELQTVPWDDGIAPWERPHQTDGKKLQHEYEINSPHILSADREGILKMEYNFPTDDLRGGLDEIMENIHTIFRKEDHAFNFNITLGMILHNMETGEYRYYIPYLNSTLLDNNIHLSAYEDLTRVCRTLSRLNIPTYIQHQRPNSKWKPHLITNMLVYVYRKSYPLGAGMLPPYVKKRHCIIGLESYASDHSKVYQDNLCIFRCLALHHKQVEMEAAAIIYYMQWRQYREGKIPLEHIKFKGIDLNELPEFESCFQIRVSVLELQESGVVIPRYHPTTSFREHLHMNIYESHLSYITNMSTYASKYKCPTCDRLFKTPQKIRSHLRICSRVTALELPGGMYKHVKSIFEELDECGIRVPEHERFFPWFAVYDFESILEKIEESSSQSLRWVRKHKPISVCISSNVENYTDCKFIVNADLDTLLQQMTTHLSHISAAAESKARTKWRIVIDKLEREMESWKPLETNPEDDDENDQLESTEMGDYEPATKVFKRKISKPNVFQEFQRNLLHDEWQINYNDHEEEEDDSTDEEEIETNEQPNIFRTDERMYLMLKRLHKKLLTYFSQLPVLAFNSARYDINLIKTRLPKYLGMCTEGAGFVVKRNNSYLCICSERFRFLDISQYLPPGSSYSNFLQAFQVQEKKSVFPLRVLRFSG